MKIGIIGNGFVGKATSLIESKDIHIKIYDKNPQLCKPHGIQIFDLLDSEMIFVCVPTPSNPDGSCHTTIVENVISELREQEYSGYIVIRSTVPIGFCEAHHCCFMPEFLTEKNYMDDFMFNKNWIFGCEIDNDDFKTKARYLISNAGMIYYNNVIFMNTSEAEMVKYFKNAFLATKVAFCNEMYQFCKEKNVDYYQVKSVVCLDKRIGESHTNVPGHDGKFGFGGTCLPKDLKSVLKQMSQSFILQSVLTRNETIDRPEKDWEMDKGRTTI